MANDGQHCLLCGADLSNRRSGTQYCSPIHKMRHYRKKEDSNSGFLEPLSPSVLDEFRSQSEWRRQYQAELQRAEPKSEEQVRAEWLQRRNPGVALPYFTDKHIKAEVERKQREDEEAEHLRNGLRPEDRHDPGTIGAVAENGKRARRLNKRSGQQSGPPPGWEDNTTMPSPWGTMPASYYNR